MKLVLAVILLAGLASGIPAAAPAGCCPSPGGDDYAPVWSPSGTLVAFTRIGQIDSGTFIVRPDGSGLKQLSRQWPFSWAPSGDLLAFGGGGIDIVDTSGNVLRRLTEEDGSDPSWSPDGRFIAFRGRGGIWLVSADGGPARRVAPARSSRGRTATSQRISWSPDSAYFAFVSSRRLGRRRWDDQIHVVKRDGTGNRVVAGSRRNEEEPEWSPDGTRLVFSSARGGQRDVYVASAAGSNLVNVSKSRGYDAEPAWSPDGRTIAFASVRSGAKGLYIVPASGGAARRVTGFPESSHPDWSPDGSRLAFMGRGACRKAGILTVSSSGGSPDLITNDCYIVGSDGDDQLTGTWDRDIAYGRGGNDVIRLDTSDDEGWGETGDDRLLGEGGSDVLVGGPGHDTLVGDRGNDRLWSADGDVDELDCGPQVDWVVADRVDHISGNCEHVRLVG